MTGEVTHRSDAAVTAYDHAAGIVRGRIYSIRQYQGNLLAANRGGKQVKLSFNYKEVVKAPSHPEANIELKPGDTVVVP